MRKLTSLAALGCLALALSSAQARPFVQAGGVGGLYVKDESGNMVFVCTTSKVQSDKFEEKLKRKDALLSASHCLLDLPSNALNFYYASFDDGLSFIRLRPILRGDLSQGYDFSLWEPLNDQNLARTNLIYNALRSYPLSSRKALEFGEEIDSLGAPAGLGLAYTKGFVAQPTVDRLIVDQGSEINWIGLMSANLPCTGGCSGSSIFDNKGEVVGVLIGSLFDQTGFKHTYIVPINRVFQALENERYTQPLDKDDKRDEKEEAALANLRKSLLPGRLFLGR